MKLGVVRRLDKASQTADLQRLALVGLLAFQLLALLVVLEFGL